MASGALRTPPGYDNTMHPDESIPPAIVEAQEAFLKDLPDLLKRYPCQWVAYVGRERVEVGRTQEAVYRRCLDRGLGEEDFVVLCVEPEAGATPVFCHPPLPQNFSPQ